MDTHNMEYNSQKTRLIIPEYGRNIQMLIKQAQTIEDDEYRQAFVNRIVDLMQQMNPQGKNLEDQKLKLWKHVFRIADYDLEVLPPDGEIPRPEDYRKEPESMDYPANHTRFRHYGHNVQKLIDKALTMEAGPIRDGFVAVIGSYMKLAYKTWNKEHYISDEIIRNDLATLSKEGLELNDNASLDNLSNANRRKKRTNNNNGRNHNGRNNHKKHGYKKGRK